MSITDKHELALRQHIRRLLLDYALTHLTTNYVTYTEEAVSELLTKHLKQVPEHDPHSLTLPVDPFDALSKRLKLKELQPYGIKWTVDKTVLDYIKNTVSSSNKGRRLKTLRVWDEEAARYQNIDYVYPLHRPMSPILTRASTRETLKLGKKNNHKTYSKEMLNGSLSDVLKKHSITLADMIPYPHDKKVKIEDALGLKLTMDKDTHTSIVSFLNTLKPPASHKRHVNRHVLNFLQDEDDAENAKKDLLNKINIIRPISPPIFERNRRMGHHLEKIDRGLKSLKEVAGKVSLVDVTGQEMDIANENMAIIDGWNAYIQPRSQSDFDTPSLADSSSQIDELDDDMWLASSPQNSARAAGIKILTEAKMDDFIFSREERLYGAKAEEQKHAVVDSIIDGKSLSSFIPSLVSLPNSQLENIDLKVPIPGSSPTATPSISFSILGQPPSEPDSELCRRNAGAETSDNFDDVLKRMYREVEQESRGDFGAIIMKEKVDDKDGVLMDVPTMPRPRKIEPDSSLPKDLKSLVSEKLKGDLVLFKPIKKVTGVKPLNIELSWRPFNFGSKVPTHDEVTDVANALEVNEEVRQRLNTFEESKFSNAPSIEAYTSTPEKDISGTKNDFDAEADFVLTRAERKRLAQSSGRILEYEEPQESLTSSNDVVLHKYAPSVSEPPMKKIKELSPHPQGNVEVVQPEAAFNGTPDLWDSAELNNSLRDDVPMGSENDDETLPLTPVYFSDMALTPPDALVHDSTFADVSNMLTHDLAPYEYGNPFEFKQSSQVGEVIPSLVNLTADSESFLIQNDLDVPIVKTGKLLDIQSQEVKPDDFAALKLDKLSLSEFLQIRGRGELVEAMTSNIPEPEPQRAPVIPVVDELLISEIQTTPAELTTDAMTVQLPETWDLPTTKHRYMVSVDLIQKNILIDYLDSELCAVELIEREDLYGVDVIMTPDAAVIFFPLAVLPSQCTALCSRLVSLSWSFLDILVIFEAFPASYLYRSDTTSLKPLYAYSPPVIKATKKLRRDLSLYEGVDEKNAECAVRLAFANTVEEAAIFARAFGEGVIDCNVPSRNYIGWLTSDEPEGEKELAITPGMNAFAACVILNSYTLDNLLRLSAEQRTDLFGSLIGLERINYLNLALDQRMELDPVGHDIDMLNSMS